MQQATRTFFPNYFNGSEIVVAGRLADGPLDQLRVEVTASNGKKFVVLKAHVPVERQTAGRGGPGGAGPGPEDAGGAGPNPLQRLWSYLTVKELLSSWLRSGGGREKERLRQKAQALAVNSHFLTPFTAMKLKQARGPEQGAGAFGVSAATGPGTAVQSLPPGTGRGPPGVLAASSPGQGHPAVVSSVLLLIFSSSEPARSLWPAECAGLWVGFVAPCGFL